VQPWVWTEYAPGKFDWRKDRYLDTNEVALKGIDFNADKTKVVSCNQGKTGEVIIPEGVKTIGKSVFFNCHSLTKFKIFHSTYSI
jgi:hypothetical protein